MTRRGRARREDIPDERPIVYGKSTGIYVDNDKWPLDWARCGSEANYMAHVRRGQKPCDACTKGMLLARSVRRQKQRQRNDQLTARSKQ